LLKEEKARVFMLFVSSSLPANLPHPRVHTHTHTHTYTHNEEQVREEQVQKVKAGRCCGYRDIYIIDTYR
jgi:hypothetical protein